MPPKPKSLDFWKLTWDDPEELRLKDWLLHDGARGLQPEVRREMRLGVHPDVAAQLAIMRDQTVLSTQKGRIAAMKAFLRGLAKTEWRPLDMWDPVKREAASMSVFVAMTHTWMTPTAMTDELSQAYPEALAGSTAEQYLKLAQAEFAHRSEKKSLLNGDYKGMLKHMDRAPQSSRPPLTAEHAEALVAMAWKSGLHLDRTIAVTMMTCYYAVARWNDVAQLGRNAVGLEQNHVILTLWKTKTNQPKRAKLGTLKTKEDVRKRSNKVFSVVMKRFLTWRDESFPDCTLLFPNGSRPVTIGEANEFLKRASDVLKLPHPYTTHSGRIGAATTLLNAGKSLGDVQMLGCWTSDVVKKYWKTPLEYLAVVAEGLDGKKPGDDDTQEIDDPVAELKEDVFRALGP